MPHFIVQDPFGTAILNNKRILFLSAPRSFHEDEANSIHAQRYHKSTVLWKWSSCLTGRGSLHISRWSLTFHERQRCGHTDLTKHMQLRNMMHHTCVQYFKMQGMNQFAHHDL